VHHTLTCMDLEKLKKFTVLRAIPDQLLYSLLIWPDHSSPASYGPDDGRDQEGIFPLCQFSL